MSQKVYDIVTQAIIDKLETGTAPWQHYAKHSKGTPRNFASGKAYRGINAFALSFSGYIRPEWMTYKQATELGAQVRKGEKSTPIMFCMNEERDDGSKKFCIRFYSVFNVAQVDGLKLPELPQAKTTLESIESAEKIAQNMPQRPRIDHREMNVACYRPMTDDILMPSSVTCSSAEYYSVLFHEMGHSTGHHSRLDRDSLTKINAFGSHNYSKEELVAEMTAAFLCAEAEILPQTLDNSAAYCQSWLKVLKNDRSMLIQAAGQAQKAADFILDRKVTK